MTVKKGALDYMAQQLSDIRVEIDSIDTQLHDLLLRRADLVASVAAAKAREGLQIVQPAREARMIRRLLARHRDPLPRQTIVGIWRELVGAVALMQSGMRVVVADCGRDSLQAMREAAKTYFGDVVPMQDSPSCDDTVACVAQDETVFAVLPWLDESETWWVDHFELFVREQVSVIAALPCGGDVSAANDARSVVVSHVEFLPSDDDVSFIAIDGADITADQMRACAVQVGVELMSFTARGGKILIEVKGYITGDDAALGSLQSALRDLTHNDAVSCYGFGGYPVVPDITQ